MNEQHMWDVDSSCSTFLKMEKMENDQTFSGRFFRASDPEAWFKFTLFIFVFISAGLFSTAVAQSLAIKGKTYQLRFSDEFNGTAVDTTKWQFRTDSKHWSTQLPLNNVVKDGLLQIQLKKETVRNMAYTGGGLISKDTFGYGYYETRMMTPKGAGWHSSFWLMGYDGSGGTSPSNTATEIDILENDSKITLGYRTNLHIWKGTHKDVGGEYVSSENLNQDFQTVACLYLPDSLFYYYNQKLVDKKEIGSVPKSGLNIWLTCIASFLGGTEKVDDALLPSALLFDYVRFYTLKKD
ncbi:MAG TPA: glycoside hydrolase family 16 protein [Catalimonadaceae bacterium]|nr:glycoside hydrolase family 16 protein [Catalimonadaceae bacterium]HPI09972.1 glycoside hydrolase family 16 protein [Catalimonadaceae bacterium]